MKYVHNLWQLLSYPFQTLPSYPRLHVSRRGVVRGETAADRRRASDYGTLHRFYQESSWLASSESSASLTSGNGHQQDGDADSFLKKLQLTYGHVAQGPPPPTTSNGE
ncbi:hypothetical protein E2C01_074928 [Portunus trituberculatus]|uniref:Uncharacterized protein n=1 Tax=Portunus trituberculatus TaxID=210409 RepID=A0A5B7I750_PORTR|nr:hypothetical protein [Portunus trituberculatus]